MSRPSNEERAEWAKQSVELFANNTGLDVDAELDSAVVDLLANMMHLCEEEGLNFESLLDSAKMHYEADVEEDRETAGHQL